MTTPHPLFHTVEKCFAIFPHNGKLFSTLWKTFFSTLFLLATIARAALPEPPELPFPLPTAADLTIHQTSTVTTPDQFLHVVALSRPLTDIELAEFSATLAQRNWKPQVNNSSRDLAAVQHLQTLAPTAQLQQPFDAVLQLLDSGMKSWTLDTIQLLYTPGQTTALALSFPLSTNAVPASAGTFTADLPLPLHDATFSQSSIQANPSQITRMEIWLSNTPPELFLPQAEPLLLAAGWTPPSPTIPPNVNPDNQVSRDRLFFMETLMKNVFRVYHRNTSQLTLLHTPAHAETASAPTHSYTLILRTFLQWPPPNP